MQIMSWAETKTKTMKVGAESGKNDKFTSGIFKVGKAYIYTVGHVIINDCCICINGCESVSVALNKCYYN